MDLFACKAMSAKNFLDGKGFRTVFTSFSSISPYDKSYKQKTNSFIHIGGKVKRKVQYLWFIFGRNIQSGQS